MLITTNTHRRKPIFDNPSHAREAIETFYRVQERMPFFLYAFVIMPDHAHFLVKVPVPGSISKIMNLYKTGVSVNIGIGPIWQSRFHVRIPRSVLSTISYIHWNPVKAGLVQNPEDYSWSSASGNWISSLLTGSRPERPLQFEKFFK